MDVNQHVNIFSYNFIIIGYISCSYRKQTPPG